MNKLTDIKVKDALITFEDHPFRTPLKFGGRVMDKHRIVNVQVTVETRDKKRATGLGSMPVAPVWAWPSAEVSPEQAEKAMCDFSERVLGLVDSLDEYAHPVDLIYFISAEYAHLGKVIAREHRLPESVPPLAQLVAASPLDAAVHDGYGKVHGRSSFDVLSADFMNHDLSHYLDDNFQGEYLDRYTRRAPVPQLPLYHLVGALDPLTPADVSSPLNDGLPVTLGEWIAANGLTHLKIKLNGDDLAWDVNRVLAVEQVTAEAQKRRGCSSWCYSLDFNEKCAHVEYVLDFLKQIQAAAPQAYDRVQYIEQPTHRDLKSHPDNRMHQAAALKPVVIDESLVDYESLQLAQELGYSGVALKACKGHTEALFAAAAAQKFGLFLCVQDLTCPGRSFLHSASLAAHIPGVAAIEGNARQFCPAANKIWSREIPGMFEITSGTVDTSHLNGPGLGF